MSQLEQAKREAKRLLKIAQSQQNTIHVKSLSEARSHIATINGYSDWHAYEENLKRKDMLRGINIEKKINTALPKDFDYIDYYNQKIEFIAHFKLQQNQNILIKELQHTPINLGKIKNQAFKSEVLLEDYPVTAIGCIGSGMDASLLSMAAQYIENNEGVIYIDAKGDNSYFTKLFSHCKKSNRLDDLFAINFLARSTKHTRKPSHTIDPINPLIGHENIFKSLFGDTIGYLMHSIALEAQKNNMILDATNLKSILMLPNLVEWYSSKIWGENASKKIKSYLEEKLGLTKELDNLEEEELYQVSALHAEFCIKAHTLIEEIISYETYGVFSKEPELSLYEVFVQRKIIAVLLPWLDKCGANCLALAQLITGNIHAASNQVEKDFNTTNNHFQNIIFNNATLLFSETLAPLVFSKFNKINHWILAFDDYPEKPCNDSMDRAIASSKAIIMMHSEFPQNAPLHLSGRIFKNIANPTNIFHNRHILKELQEGMSYVYIEKPSYLDKSSLQLIRLSYIEPERPKEVYLNRPEPKRVIEKSLSLSEIG